MSTKALNCAIYDNTTNLDLFFLSFSMLDHQSETRRIAYVRNRTNVQDLAMCHFIIHNKPVHEHNDMCGPCSKKTKTPRHEYSNLLSATVGYYGDFAPLTLDCKVVPHPGLLLKTFKTRYA